MQGRPRNRGKGRIVGMGPTLQEHLDQTIEAGPLSRAVASVTGIVAAVCADIADLIALGAVSGDLGRECGTNAGGDRQKVVDVRADALFRTALRGSAVAALVSEEREEVETLDPDGCLGLAIDPIDGSGNIDLNMPIGTIFSLVPYPAAGAAGEGRGFAWSSGATQCAAGYVLYGPRTTLVLTTGRTVDLFTLDRDTRTFRLTRPDLRIPPASAEYAINSSNYRHWEEPVRAYVDDCLAGAAGPFGRDFNTRWHGALVAEVHRILLRGGIYLYPADTREGHRDGRLRLVYEAAPMAFLVERAGGAASDGRRRILDIAATSPHQHVPLILGSPTMVEPIEQRHHRPGIWPETTAPLFGRRGLFRS